MGTVIAIRPNNAGDAAARCLSDWCIALLGRARAKGHAVGVVIDGATPCKRHEAERAIASAGELILFFGHGVEDSLLGEGLQPVVDQQNVQIAANKTIVAMACKTARKLGPDAITNGIHAYLGFNIKLGWLPPSPGNRDVFGDAILDGLEVLAGSGSIQDARDELVACFEKVVDYFDNGAGKQLAHGVAAYFTAIALAGHTVALGKVHIKPLV